MENQRLGPVLQDHEVEVLSHEGHAKPGALPEKNRIDQRMPLKFVTNFLLPSKESARSNRLIKTLLPESKTRWQHQGQDSAVNQTV